MTTQDSRQSTTLVPPEQALREMFIGYRISQAIYVAAKLGIADLLKDGPKSSEGVAKSAEANPDALHRLLRVLASVGIFAEVGQRRFALTPAVLEEISAGDPDAASRRLALVQELPILALTE